LIAKVKGFDSIDDYVIDVLKRELESIRKGGDVAADFGESIAEYLQNIIPPINSSDDDDKSIEENSSIVGKEKEENEEG
jgi:hypothetical protein